MGVRNIFQLIASERELSQLPFSLRRIRARGRLFLHLNRCVSSSCLTLPSSFIIRKYKFGYQLASFYAPKPSIIFAFHNRFFINFPFNFFSACFFFCGFIQYSELHVPTFYTLLMSKHQICSLYLHRNHPRRGPKVL